MLNLIFLTGWEVDVLELGVPADYLAKIRSPPGGVSDCGCIFLHRGGGAIRTVCMQRRTYIS